jgi:hypothetical protein
MTLEIDHLFVCCSPGAPEAELLLGSGFSEGQPNTHPGQGTSCRRFFFRNGYLELLWIHDEREVRSDLVTPSALWERIHYRQTGYSPFGIGLRHSMEDAGPLELPFTTWAYRPPYLPPSLEICVADTGRQIAEPFIFVLPGGARPDEPQPGRRQPLVHTCGAEGLTNIEITVVSEPGSTALKTIEQVGMVVVKVGMAPLVKVKFDNGRSGEILDCRPSMPLVLRW